MRLLKRRRWQRRRRRRRRKKRRRREERKGMICHLDSPLPLLPLGGGGHPHMKTLKRSPSELPIA
jgi:hypothetical protein